MLALAKHSLALSLLFCFLATTAKAAPFIEENSDLKQFLFEEPDTRIQLGFGLSPVNIFTNRVGFSVDMFQLHFNYKRLDWEVLSASYGASLSTAQNTDSRSFILRSAPKFKINSLVSVGPLVGIEFISFPDISSVIYKNTLSSPAEPFSSQGLIYGVEATQTFTISKDMVFKVNELLYKQTYSVKDAGDGWQYVYQDLNLQTDPTPIQGGFVFVVELCFIY